MFWIECKGGQQRWLELEHELYKEWLRELLKWGLRNLIAVYNSVMDGYAETAEKATDTVEQKKC